MMVVVMSKPVSDSRMSRQGKTKEEHFGLIAEPCVDLGDVASVIGRR
jgi:hypothetical protein